MSVSAQVIDRVLATVNGHLITLSDVRTTMTLGLTEATTVEAALDRLIERVLVLQEVERFAPPEPAASIVEARVATAVSALGTPDQTRETLARLGVDHSYVRQWVRDDLRIQAYTEQRFAGALEPTSDELENYYREHSAEFVRDGREMTAEEAQAVARERVMASRRRTLVADWLDGLRKRASIVRPAGGYTPR